MSKDNKLKDKILGEVKDSLKSWDKVRASTLRMLLAAVTNKEIELRKKDIGLSDEEILSVVSSEVKKRKDATEEFKKGGRDDLVQKEEEELKILEKYLPEEMADEELERLVEISVRETGAKTQADFGNVMKSAMGVLRGKVSGERVSAMVKKKLGK